MSIDDVKQMFGQMEKDAALKNKYAVMIQEHRKDAETRLAEKLIELGKTSGFTFSKDDLFAARSEFTDKVNAGKELSDGDLADVAGGVSRKAAAVCVSIFAVGIGCAVLSAVVHKTEPGCAAVMTTSDPNCKNT